MSHKNQIHFATVGSWRGAKKLINCTEEFVLSELVRMWLSQVAQRITAFRSMPYRAPALASFDRFVLLQYNWEQPEECLTAN